MDEIWTTVKSNFDVCLQHIPYHNNIINTVAELDFRSNPNILFYGCKGIPFDFMWETALRKKFGTYTKTQYVWQKNVTYYETQYFFEIDLLYPHQTKDMTIFSEFIKSLITHPCIHEDRHIIILKSIEQISDKLKATALRVLLERYSKNAFFICTTTQISGIEAPLQSRFLLIRCPVFTIEEIEACFISLGRIYHPLLRKSKRYYDFYYALFISWLAEKYPNDVTESLCLYNLPLFYEFLQLQTTLASLPSMEDIRKITQKICIHNGSFLMICEDLVQFYDNIQMQNPSLCNDISKLKEYIIKTCAEVDHMCTVTEEYRKPIYVEFLLHKLFYLSPLNTIKFNKIPVHEPPKKEPKPKKSTVSRISKKMNNLSV